MKIMTMLKTEVNCFDCVNYMKIDDTHRCKKSSFSIPDRYLIGDCYAFEQVKDNNELKEEDDGI